MSALETAQYLIATYDLPLTIDSYTQAAMAAVDRLYRSVSLKPGVEQMLARLERQGARMCVCSATWQFMCERVLGRLGVLDKFQFVLTAGNDNSKHRPDVFYQALGRLGAATPPSASSVRTRSTRPGPPTTRALSSSGWPTRPAPPTRPPSVRSAASS